MDEESILSFAPGFSFTTAGVDDIKSDDKVSMAVREAKTKYSLDDNLLQDMEDKDVAISSDSDDEIDFDESNKTINFEDSPVGPAKSFADMRLSKPIERALDSLGFTLPTPIQSIAIPVGLTGRDICGAAETGSGKTAAFLIPIIERLLHKSSRVSGCRVLILLPTRELALQCHTVATRLLRFVNKIECAALVGGESLAEQRVALRRRPDIVIGTPGRIIDHLHNTASFHFDDVDILVLDEADRMLEEGFQDELEEIVKHCKPSRQSLLFSATMTDRVEELARLSLNKPVRLFMDAPGSLTRLLEQHFVRVRKEEDRLAIMLSVIKQELAKKSHHRMIVFLPTKEMCHRVAILWKLASLPECVELHGKLDQATRSHNLTLFREGRASCLLATDVAARGLDIHNVTLIINYSLPPAFPQYCHRVGRTARAGKTGRAISLIGESDRKLMRQIIRNTPPSASRPCQRRLNSSLVVTLKKFLVDSKEDVLHILQLEQEDNELKKAEAELRRAESVLEEKMSKKSHTLATKSKSDNKKGISWFQKKSSKRPDIPQSKATKGCRK